MDPRVRIRIHPKMSWIRNTGFHNTATRRPSPPSWVRSSCPAPLLSSTPSPASSMINCAAFIAASTPWTERTGVGLCFLIRLVSVGIKSSCRIGIRIEKLPVYLFFYMELILNVVLRRANPLLGELEGVGSRNGSCPPQNHYVPCHINNRYINSYNKEIHFVYRYAAVTQFESTDAR